jgi:hypothetical protein
VNEFPALNEIGDLKNTSLKGSGKRLFFALIQLGIKTGKASRCGQEYRIERQEMIKIG